MGIALTCLFMAFSCQAKESKKDAASTQKVVIEHLNKAGFMSKVANYEKNPNQWVYLGDKPCIIDFYASWCGPCRKLAPILEEIAQEYADEIIVYKINVDQEKELAVSFGVQSIPSLLFCPMQGTPQMAAGFMDKEMLKEAIGKVLLP